MLPKASRLTRREFELLLKGSRVRHYPLFSLRAAPGFGRRKAAVVVSKKEAPLASRRANGRRKAYAALRPLFSSIPSGTALAVFLRREALTIPPPELRDALGQALKDIFR